MARVSLVEFVCIVAIGVAMVELPGHHFLRPAGTDPALTRTSAASVAEAARPRVVVPPPPRRNQ